jgi:ferredoxin--NADP+ reductase
VVVENDPGVISDDSGVADPTARRIVFRFHSAPEEILGDSWVSGVRVRTGDTSHVIAADLVVRSIGYRSTPIAGLPFDQQRGVFPNVDGRLLDTNDDVIPGSYVLGWAKRGPTGGIGANMVCAEATVDEFLIDAEKGLLTGRSHGQKHFDALLRQRKAPVIGYRGVRAIDRAERRRGEELNRPRVKFTSIPEMVKAAGLRKR